MYNWLFKNQLTILRVGEPCVETGRASEPSTHAMVITLKSSQFQGSLRKVNSPTQKPRAKIFTRDSNV